MGKKRFLFEIPFRFGELFLGLWCLLFAACTTDYPSAGEKAEEDFLQLDFVLTGTRAEIDDNGSGFFEENDKIGLYVVNGSRIEYRELTYNGNEWLPRLRRSEFGEGELMLSAHYPALPVAEGFPPTHYPYSCTDIRTEEDYARHDLLYAGASVQPGENHASLVFRHLFHRLEINLTGADAQVELKVRSRAEGTIDLLTGSTAVSEEADFEWITPLKKSEKHYRSLIYPQEADPYREAEGLIKIVGNGKESIVKAPDRLADGEELSRFESGKQTRITLNMKQETDDLSNKVLWVYGVDAPAFPGKEQIVVVNPGSERFPVGEWFRYNWTFSEDQYLTWSEDCGWFDCNKSMDYSEGDANICWAASASNLIIWWMVHNRPYIEAYDKEYGSDVVMSDGAKVVERPSDEFKPLYASDGSVNRAPVFEFFKRHFPDKGSWNSAGVNWFLTGSIKDLQTAPDMVGFPGFFHKIFGRNDFIAVDSDRMPNREQFNKFIIDALLNQKAIGFNVFDIAGPGTGNHAMVIWGVELDAEGFVSHVYYCDNNNAEQDAYGAVIKRAEIAYVQDSSVPEAGEKIYTYLKRLDSEDGTVGKMFKITCLCAVDLRRDIWEKKYPEISRIVKR